MLSSLISTRALLGISAGVVASKGFFQRYTDTIQGNDVFSNHVKEQHRKHFLSGMQEPFVPGDTVERAIFDANFSQYAQLLPKSREEFAQRKTISAPVYIKPLSMCPADLPRSNAGTSGGTVVVGGPPALVSSAQQSPLTYINDSQQIAIAVGSAHHLEWDSPSEGPTTLQPVEFMAKQVLGLFSPHTLAEAEATGFFPWSTLDWKGWIGHPSTWAEGVRLAVAFQRTAMASQASVRSAVLKTCEARCRANEAFYQQLHRDIVALNAGDESRGLFVPGVNGSLMVARDAEEINDLTSLREDLARENRQLLSLPDSEFKARYGFTSPYAACIVDKTHDKVLQPHFMRAITSYLASKGSSIIDGRVTAVYTDDPAQGGLVEYVPTQGVTHAGVAAKRVLVPFSRLVMSLGAQRVHTVAPSGEVSRPALDVVCARGVSSLAIAYVPQPAPDCGPPKILPPVVLCGATNDCVVVGGPVSVTRDVDGHPQQCHAYLLKVTSGACITPNVLDDASTHYHAVSAVGMFTAVRRTLDCDVLPVAVWGCNRQMSQFGETHWLEVCVIACASVQFLSIFKL